MNVVRFLFPLLAVLVTWGAQAVALTDTLEELIQEKGIIMPDLAERYSDAEAVIILDEKDIDQSKMINPVYITRHVVVKILKESAVEKFRTVKLPFYQEVKMVDIEARTINDGNIIKVGNIPERKVDLEGEDADFIFPLEQNNTLFAVRSEEVNMAANAGDFLKITENPVFHKKGADVWRIRQIDFPELRTGSVIEYYYRVEQKRVILYDCFFFQHRYPILKSSYLIRNAKLLRFAYEINNFTAKPDMVFEPRFTNLESQYNMKIRTMLRTIDVTDNPENWQFYGHQLCHIQVDTLDAYPVDLYFAPCLNNLSPRIDVVMREALNPWQKSTKNIDIRRENFSPNWNFPVYRLGKGTILHERRSRKAKEVIAEAIKDASTPEEKVNAAVRWVRENIKDNGELDRWEGYFWGYQPEDPDVVLREGVANAADIVTFLVNTLQLNDLYVYPAYAKSRKSGNLLVKVFMETQFDVALVALEVASRKYKFWQASTDIPLPVDYLDCSLEDTRVLINTSAENDVSYSMAELPSTPSDKNRSTLNAALTLGEDGSAAGSLEQELTGHLSAGLRRTLNNTAADRRPELWKETLKGKFDTVTLSSEPRLDDPAVLNPKYTAGAEVTLGKVCRAVEGGLAVRAAILTDPFSSALSGEEREIDVEFPHQAEFSCDVELKVPAGFSLPDSLPAPMELKTRGLYYHRVLAKKDKNTLLLKREFKIDQPIMEARRYNRRYASIFADIQKADAEEIVLPRQ